MIHLPTVALLAILSNPGQPQATPQPVLLDFHADWCGPCRMMEPVVQRLAAEGYAVRKIDIQQQPQLAKQYAITAVPTFVILAGDREVQRIVGPTSFEQLAGLLRPAATSPPAGKPAAVACAVTQAPPSAAAPGRDTALRATVRLRVEDGGGNSLGTGTIIHTHEEEALVMTCGHIFRDSKGQGRIIAEVFQEGSPRTVPGTLLAYDLENDTALVAIRPGIPVAAVPVAPPGYAIRPGDDVFSVGCDHGRDPSVRDSRVTAVNKYELPDNIVVAGAPVIGRSGGGLFSRDGRLIGVCNLANNEDDEGIYAALTLLHHSLDREELSWVYQRAADQLADGMPPAEPRDPGIQRDGPNPLPPAMPRAMPGPVTPLAGESPRRSDPLAPRGGISPDDEVYLILRSRSDPRGEPRLIYLNALPPQLIAEITRQAGSTGEPDTVLAVRDGLLPAPNRENGASGGALRGQNLR